MDVGGPNIYSPSIWMVASGVPGVDMAFTSRISPVHCTIVYSQEGRLRGTGGRDWRRPRDYQRYYSYHYHKAQLSFCEYLHSLGAVQSCSLDTRSVAVQVNPVHVAMYGIQSQALWLVNIALHQYLAVWNEMGTHGMEWNWYIIGFHCGPL